ncbi:Ig heavy chain C region, secreted form [Misgurnus anguillicaudatus]|uniref:Ig heavy chain C region, secreted form n=1 Tax=Misgurnus anguillicaudatus TaxID=75329 RepID=UPI003CCF8514
MMSECTTSATQTLGCLASEYSPATALSFKWTDQSGNALTDFVQHPAVEMNGKALKISHITVKKDKLNETSITCETVHPSERVKKTFRKVIAQAPTLSLVPVITQKSTSVMCVIEDFNPKAITVQWLENNINMQQRTKLDYTQNEKGLYTARTLYTVSSESWNKHTEYTCEVTHMGQVKHVTKNFKATLELTLKSPIQRNIFLFGDVILQAVVSGNEHKAVEDASMSCEVENKALTLSKAVIQAQDNSQFQKIHNVTVNRDKWFAGKMVTCTISDKNIKQEISFNKGDSKKPSVVLYEQHSKNTKSSHVSLLCEVSSPQLGDVYIMWKVDNGKYEEGKTSAPIRLKDSTSVISLFEVSDKQYKESMILCAVVHANMDNTRSPLITTARKSQPSCHPCPVCSADYI